MKLLPVLSYYTGKSGTYISALPTAATVKLLEPLRELLIEEDFKNLHPVLNWHITVVHSKDNIEDVDQLYGLFPMESDRTFPASVDYVTWWPGHNKKGYLVVKLKSPELSRLNKQLRDLGLKVSFDDYEAHITLAEEVLKTHDEDQMHAIVSKLNLYVMKNLIADQLEFTGIRLEDVS